ncbi:MAG: DUF523 domain-containing protein [Deltaproteobacteria bacterium]|nr:DUF523 domain-containing protein [Deltaproteobacteria bacterium]
MKNKPIYLISACLCGQACRYDGGPAKPEVSAIADGASCPTVPAWVSELPLWLEQGLALAVCPELEGGLPVPRPPGEIVDGRVMGRDGRDYTHEYRAGAARTLELARCHGITRAILKERSPSCGSSLIYDGSFSGRRIAGSGITASLLMQNGVLVASELNYQELFLF